MFARYFSVFSILLITGTLACGTEVTSRDNPFDPKSTNPAPASVTGRVEAEGRTIVAGRGPNEDILVQLLLGEAVASEAQTDAEGIFTLPEIQPGRYRLSIVEVGFQPFGLHDLRVEIDDVLDLGVLTLASNIATEQAPVVEGVAKLEGVADGEHGGIHIRAVGTPYFTLTDPDGSFQLVLTDGTFDLELTYPDYQTELVTGVALALGDQHVLPAEVLLLSDPGSVVGVVMQRSCTVDPADAIESPASGTVAALQGTAHTGVAAVDGSFGITGVSAGLYDLQLTLTGWESREGITVQVRGGKATTLADPIVLEPSRGALSGMVVLTGESDHSGVLIQLNGTQFFTLTAADGSWRIDGVCAGTGYEVVASRDKFVTTSSGGITVTAGETFPVPVLNLERQQGGLNLNGGRDFTSLVDVSYVLGAPAGTTHMRLSEDLNLFSVGTTPGDPEAGTDGWVAFVNTGTVSLIAPDGSAFFEGTRTVYAQFYGAGSFSGVLEDEIILDQTAPLGPSIEIEDGSGFSNDPDGALLITLLASEVPGPSVDRVAGLGEVKLINTDPATCGSNPCPAPTVADWAAANALPYNRVVDHPLGSPGTDEEKEVWVAFSDRADNWAAPVWARVVLDREAPDGTSVAINSGAPFARTDRVFLGLSAADENPGLQMRLANESTFLGSVWRPFSPSVTWFLDAQADGVKQVWVQFMDAAGNQSQALMDDINLDRALPTAVRLDILQGAYTSAVLVDLDIVAADATEMIIADNPSFLDGAGQPLAFQPYATAATFTLDGTEGMHQLFVEFRDDADNRSEVLSVSVTLDLTDPAISGVGLIEGVLETATGFIHLSQSTVTLLTTAIPGPLDAHEMRVDLVELDAAGTETARATGAWGVFSPSRPTNLTTNQNRKRLEVLLRDAAGNSSSTATLEVVYDPAPPVVTNVILAGGAAFVGSPQVSLQIVVGVPADAAQMRLSNRADFAGALWQPFAATVDWTLPSVDQLHTVYVEVRDLAGNVGGSSGTVELDRAPPTGLLVTLDSGAAWSTDLDVAVLLTAADSASGMDSVELSSEPGFTVATTVSWLPAGAATVSVASFTLPDVEGAATVYARFSDAVGNRVVATGTIVVDRAAPTGAVSIDDGADYATGTSVTLFFTAPADTARVAVANGTIASCATPPNAYAAYVPSQGWVLDAVGDGVKTVTICLEDSAGNTAQATDTITLDRANPVGTLDLAGGAGAVSARSIPYVLTGVSTDVVEMAVAEGSIDCGTVGYGGYVPTGSLLLSEPDGAKTILVCLRDAAGRTVELTDAVTLDRVAPTGSLSVAGGSAWTNTDQVTLAGTAVGALEYALANESIDCTSIADAAWSPVVAGAFSRTCPGSCWGLLPSDGVRTVRACLRDAAGNTAIVEDDIELDATAPVGSVAIDSGDAYATTTAVNLFFTAPTDTARVAVANGAIASCATPPNAYVPYVPSQGWVLASAGDGVKTVTVCFEDSAGNTAQAVDTIILDRANPVGTLQLAGGDTFVGSKTVTYSLSGVSTDVVEMAVAEGSIDCGTVGYGGFGTSGSVSLSEPDGPKTILICLRDAAGRTVELNDTVTLDRLPPTGSLTLAGGATWSTTDQIALAGTAVGATEYALANESIDCTSIGAAAWSPVVAGAFSRSCPGSCWGLLPSDGVRTVKACLRDAAGNTAIVEDDLQLDATAPAGSVDIDSGAAYATATAVTLFFSAPTDTARVAVANGAIASCATPPNAYVSYVSSLGWVLAAAGDGMKTVTVCYEDSAGNTAQTSDTIILDRANPVGTLQLAGGDTFVGSKTVTYSLSGVSTDVIEMAVAEGSIDCGTVGYGGFGTSGSVSLSEPDGSKTILICLRDAAGRTVELNDTVTLDRQPPTGSLSLAGGVAWTTTDQIALAGTAVGATEYALANESIDCTSIAPAAWAPVVAGAFSRSCPGSCWGLMPADGLRTVKACLRDAAGNTAIVEDDLQLDATPPTAAVTIDGDADYSSSTSVQLQLETSADVIQMRVANGNNCLAGGLQAYVASQPHTLQNTQGLRRVSVCFYDAAGNSSPAFDTITLDSVLPSGSLSIDGGNAWTTSQDVLLTLSSTADVSGMAVVDGGSLDCATATYATFQGTLAWRLPLGDGGKSVTACFIDPAGNTASATDAISLDTQAPTAPGIIVTVLTDRVVSLQWTTPAAPDLAGFTLERRLENEGTFSVIGASLPASTTTFDDLVSPGELGMHRHFRVRAFDARGLNSPYSIALDAGVPTDRPEVVYLNPFDPPERALSWTRPPGTALLLPTYRYEVANGVLMEEGWATNSTFHRIPAARDRFNERLGLVAQNVDATLTWELELDFGTRRETIATTGNNWAETRIAVDAEGTAHLAWVDTDVAPNELLYLKLDGRTQPQLVAQVTNRYLDIDVDSGGIAHIVHTGVDADLSHAVMDGSASTVILVGNFSNIRMELDSTDTPHVVLWSITQRDLNYVRIDGSPALETLDATNDTGRYPSIAIDANDIPHIAYQYWDSRDLRYLRKDGVSTPVTIDSVGTVGYTSAIAIDPTNEDPVIAYRDLTNQTAKIARIDGVSTPQTVLFGVSGAVGIAVDHEGIPHVAARTSAAGATQLVYLKVDGLDTERILDGTGGFPDQVDLVLDRQDRPHFIYANNSYQIIRYLELDTELKATLIEGPSTGSLDIAVDPADLPIAVYTNVWSNTLREVRLGERWTQQTLDTSGSGFSTPSVAVDGIGRAHIAYRDNTVADLLYLRRDGVSTPVTLDSVGSVGLNPSIDVTPGGAAYVSYYDSSNTALKYVRADTAGVPVMVDNGGAIGVTSSLSIDSSGLPWVAYVEDIAAPAPYQAWYRPLDGVTPRTLVGESGYTNGLVLDDADLLHYVRVDEDNGGLLYNEGLPSVAQSVDFGNQSQIFLDTAIDSHGVPHVAYVVQDFDHLVAYARLDGISQPQRILTEPDLAELYLGPNGLGGSEGISLALDSQDRAHIALYQFDGNDDGHFYYSQGKVSEPLDPEQINSMSLPSACEDTELFGTDMVGCAGVFTWDERTAICAEAGLSSCTAAQWISRRASLTPRYNYWTDDDLHYGGSSSGNCWVSTTLGNACGSPMRVCNSTLDPLGNTCNWEGCGYETTTPNEYFGGCGGNLTAGVLCCQ